MTNYYFFPLLFQFCQVPQLKDRKILIIVPFAIVTEEIFEENNKSLKTYLLL